MLPGIKEGQQKVSKSDPASAIFMEDDEVFSSLYIGVFFNLSSVVTCFSIMTTFDRL